MITYYPIYDTSRRYPDRAPVASQSFQRSEPRLNREQQPKINPKEFGKVSQMFCKLAVSDNTGSHAESQPLYFSSYISAAGGVFPSGNRYLSLFTASGFFIPSTGSVPSYLLTSNSDK